MISPPVEWEALGTSALAASAAIPASAATLEQNIDLILRNTKKPDDDKWAILIKTAFLSLFSLPYVPCSFIYECSCVIPKNLARRSRARLVDRLGSSYPVWWIYYPMDSDHWMSDPVKELGCKKRYGMRAGMRAHIKWEMHAKQCENANEKSENSY